MHADRFQKDKINSHVIMSADIEQCFHYHTNIIVDYTTRAAVGMGIPMGIPMGMGMVWVWGL